MYDKKKGSDVEPIIKWAGGKRKLLKEIIKYVPKSFNTYYEPFVGSGALLFYLKPEKAVINDINDELINLYEVVKNEPLALTKALKEHELKNSEEYYYLIRNLDRNINFKRLDKVTRASRFLYLNKAGFNGLYRVNKKGYFNVPFGKNLHLELVNENKILKMSKYFNDNEIVMKSLNYKEVVKEAKKGDFIYFDPPYVPLNETSSFTSYTSEGFNLKDQIELVEVCKDLKNKGINFILSNSYTKTTLDLFKDFDVRVVTTRRQISSKSSSRTVVEEILVVSTDN